MLVGSTCRGSMATLDMDCVHKYVHHIADVSPPKPEYMQHFLRRGHTFAEMEAAHSTMIEGSLPFLDREVQQTVETMVESLVFADKHMDTVSNRDLGVEVHDVPADGDCLLHAWIKAIGNVNNDELPL